MEDQDLMHAGENAENAVIDDSFLDITVADAGYDENVEPGARGELVPEGPYMFRFEFPKLKDDAQRWPSKKTKKGDPFIGTSIKAVLQRPVSNSPVTLEEFDAARMANRAMSTYISSLFMFGRSSMSDFINCVSPEKWNKNRSVREMRDAIDEIMQGIPEGIATVKWEPFYKDAGDGDKWKRLSELLESLKKGGGKKYARGAKSFPKNADGTEPLTTWEEVVGEAEEDKIQVIVMAGLDLLLPYNAEEMGA